MHGVVREVAEERRILVRALPNEFICPLGEQLGRVSFDGAIRLAIVHDLGPFLSHPIGMGSSKKPVKLIEPTVVRNFSFQCAHVPFAEGTGCVTCFVQMLRKHFDIALDPTISRRSEWLLPRSAPHSVFRRVLTGKHAGTRRSTERDGMVVWKPHTLSC